VNTISPGTLFTHQAREKLSGPRGEDTRLMGSEGTFITDSDILMARGFTARAAPWHEVGHAFSVKLNSF
jgi:hypothetical protein